jgi:hypothetical protein
MTYTDQQLDQKPGKVQAIAIMTLVDGIVNVLYGFFLAVLILVVGGTAAVTFVAATFGLGAICAPIACILPLLGLLPITLGIFEIIAGAKLMRIPPRKFNVKLIAILQIVNIITGAVWSLAVGILNLVFYNEPENQSYIDSLPS